jgi:hypothetical protein
VSCGFQLIKMASNYFVEDSYGKRVIYDRKGDW